MVMFSGYAYEIHVCFSRIGPCKTPLMVTSQRRRYLLVREVCASELYLMCIAECEPSVKLTSLFTTHPWTAIMNYEKTLAVSSLAHALKYSLGLVSGRALREKQTPTRPTILFTSLTINTTLTPHLTTTPPSTTTTTTTPLPPFHPYPKPHDNQNPLAPHTPHHPTPFKAHRAEPKPRKMEIRLHPWRIHTPRQPMDRPMEEMKRNRVRTAFS